MKRQGCDTCPVAIELTWETYPDGFYQCPYLAHICHIILSLMGSHVHPFYG